MTFKLRVVVQFLHFPNLSRHSESDRRLFQALGAVSGPDFEHAICGETTLKAALTHLGELRSQCECDFELAFP